MLKKLFFFGFISVFSALHAQEINTSYKTKKIPVSYDTIHLEKTSINSSFFKLLDNQSKVVDTSFYKINFQKGALLLKENFKSNNDSVTVQYLKFPDYLTKQYSIYDDSRVVDGSNEKTQCAHPFYKSINEKKGSVDKKNEKKFIQKLLRKL